MVAKKVGLANLPLHTGRAPRWLFNRMVKLGEAISEVIIEEYGKEEFFRRLSSPFFFQSFANVLGWDWHSSGATPVLCGALKQANLQEFGIIVTGGKGRVSRKTPNEIEKFGLISNLSGQRIEKLKYASKIIAKIDNNLIQDQYQLYTHSFFFTENGKEYVVVQQGMNSESRYARRYHWLSDNIKEFVEEPHSAICCDNKEKNVLDMTAKQSKESRKISVDVINDNPIHLKKYIQPIKQKTITEFCGKRIKKLTMQPKHSLTERDLSKPVLKQLQRAYEIQPENYEELVALKGTGAKSIRALALISELIYDTSPSWKEPSSITKFSWAHGGKDGYPRPVDRRLMDDNTKLLKNAIRQAKLGETDKLGAIKRLAGFY